MCGLVARCHHLQLLPVVYLALHFPGESPSLVALFPVLLTRFQHLEQVAVETYVDLEWYLQELVAGPLELPPTLCPRIRQTIGTVEVVGGVTNIIGPCQVGWPRGILTIGWAFPAGVTLRVCRQTSTC